MHPNEKKVTYDDLAENREAQCNDRHRNSCLDIPSYAFSVSGCYILDVFLPVLGGTGQTSVIGGYFCETDEKV